MTLFSIKDLVFKGEDFLDDISEYEDIIPIIQELQNKLIYEEIGCVGKNDCCGKTDRNYIVEIQGFIDENDEFITVEELQDRNSEGQGLGLDLFVIRIYKCVACEKWIIDILE